MSWSMDAGRFTNMAVMPFIEKEYTTLHGRLVELDQNDIELNESDSVILSNINQSNLVVLKISYRKASFNSFRFLTHDTHIVVQ